MEEEEDSQADGFVVEDGYLSDGEGGPMDADEFGAGLEGDLPLPHPFCVSKTPICNELQSG